MRGTAGALAAGYYRQADSHELRAARVLPGLLHGRGLALLSSAAAPAAAGPAALLLLLLPPPLLPSDGRPLPHKSCPGLVYVDLETDKGQSAHSMLGGVLSSGDFSAEPMPADVGGATPRTAQA